MKKETCCFACRKYTKSIHPKIVRNRQNRSMIQSDCAVCGSKKLKNIKNILKNIKQRDYSVI